MVGKEYNQSKLDDRFNQEASVWRQLYKSIGRNSFIYQDKIYRQKYALDMLGKGNGIVLDVGCGSGSFFGPLHNLGYKVVGLDSSTEMVELAYEESKDSGDIFIVQGNALKLSFKDDSFDALIAVGLIEYMPNDKDFLIEIRRVVKPGGNVVISFRNSLCFERKLWQFHRKFGIKKFGTSYFYREHNPKRFIEYLKHNNYNDILIRYCHFYPFPWPLSSVLKPINSYLGNKMEKWFSNSPISFLASTFLISFDVPGTINEDTKMNE